jgi:hypothetical protein
MKRDQTIQWTGDTATFILRARHYLKPWKPSGEIGKMKNRNYILAFVVCVICITALPVLAQRKSESKIPGDLVQQLIADINKNEKNFRLSVADLRVLHKNVRVELHDLNGDETSEFFLYIEHSDWCGAGSNCNYWVYQKTQDGYSLLVEDAVLRVKDTMTNGYHDLASETKIGFCDRNVARLYVTPYKFDGNKYQAKELEIECRAFTPTEE